jgi:hypothetical protein
MVRKFSAILSIIPIAAILIICLFADALRHHSSFGGLLSVFEVILQPENQWMLFVLVSIWCLTFLYFESSLKDLWLTGSLLVGVSVYFVNYATASQFNSALIFLVGVTLGKGVCLYLMQVRFRRIEYITFCLVILLIISSCYTLDNATNYYRSHTRWSGPWDNPNIFGLLMGTGIVLAVGQFVQSLTSTRLCSATARQAVQSQKQEGRSWESGIKRYAVIIVCLFAAILMGRGLLHSYSRGAWLAAICGLGYLVYQVFRCQVSGVARWVRANVLSVTVIMLSVFVLAFWQFRHTQHVVAGRALSVGNVNDFSWRNRVSAWEGTLQIMAEHPMLGAGWNQPAPLYDHYYLPPKTTESAAIEMNDYLMLGATLGIPALICFGMYVWLSLTRKSEVRRQISDGGIPSIDLRPLASDLWHPTCRAGAVVLLVGFWFDGGLFGLSTAAIFWILLELGAVKLPQKATSGAKAGPEFPL